MGNAAVKLRDPTMTSPDKMQSRKSVFEKLDIEGPVDMFNQLKFRTEAKYPNDMEQPACTGRQAFQRYAELLEPVLADIGGSIKIWRGKVHVEVTPNDGKSWDIMTVYRFPSTDALINLFSNPEYHQVDIHREAAIAHSKTFVCTSL